jgi:hypothetical protein
VSAVHVSFVDGPDNDGVLAGALEGSYNEVAALAFLPTAQTVPDFQQPDRLLFDLDGDGTVTLAELQATDVWATLMRPDIDADDDGTPKSLSFGFHIHFEIE